MKRRLMAFVLVLVMVLGMSTTVSAATLPQRRAADALYHLDLFRGRSAVGKDFDLDSELNRAEGVVLLLRLIGEESAANQVDLSENPFADVTEEDLSWGICGLTYAYQRGLAKGADDGNGGLVFMPQETMKDYEFLTLVLRQLGYADGNSAEDSADFVWNAPYELAQELGLVNSAQSDRSFTRGDAVQVSWNALKAEIKGTGETLAKQLIKAGVFTAAEYRDAKEIRTYGYILSDYVAPAPAPVPTPTPTPTPTPSVPSEGEGDSDPEQQADATADVAVDENGTVKEETIMAGETVSATVPAGVTVESGTEKLALTVSELEDSNANVAVEETEDVTSYDVHVEGVSGDNTVAILVNMGEVLPVGMNMGNVKLYHVENGVPGVMTQVGTLAELDAHNEFYYDPATGNVTVAMATFSEIAVVNDTTAAWEGNFDYSWYTDSVTPLAEVGDADYTIANADQLAAFGAIVGGMDGQTQDSFKDKTVKLIADVNLGDKESENNPDLIFYPIGYNSSDGKYEKTGVAVSTGFYTFEGTFDGNGHTISDFYQNTWEMKGDHNWYDATLQYYRDGMGLFGKVYGGAVKNLTVDNFSSDGEITTTGVIAAYADGATFENIAITNCNPRVYNIGNGGIVGCVGWYAKEANLKTTFTNITVDNSNKISALWGSYDVACGGIVGQYYPTSGQSAANYPKNAGIHMENCHVSAQMDVYNDVCANYQYYAYRYTGMLIGSVRENETIDGHVYPQMDGITASGCTVHFGDWNDYYYCELVDNTTASYTHDYQMSRLVEIKAIDGTTITYLDGTTGTVPASGRANYVIVDYTKGHGTDNATCYHFKDGEVWTHDMAGIQDGMDENGDGEIDLKEDKQHIYLEFNNLFTGYGWGVTTKGVDDLEGVTILDREVGNSYVKFEKAETAKDSYMNGKKITIGELFKDASISDDKLTIKGDKVQVTVSPVGDDSTASAAYTANTTDWTQGTLTFSGTGDATITITDYYFCTPTTITVNVTERQPEVKFDVVMNNGDFLHRVGNSGTVALDKLFAAKDGATIGTVSVTIEAVNGTAASGTYTSNATWTNGTIQFSGTGVVKVTITDNDYCTPTELILEVVDATNLTSATGTTSGGTFVLLCDVNASDYVYYWNSTLYGNGFTYSLNGAPTSYSSSHGHGVLITKNATLDNLVIVGDVYEAYGAYTNQDYYNAAIDVLGDTIIQNCYISGCSAPVNVRSNVTIKNTTLYGGAVANLMIKSGTVTLEDVTTANYADGRALVGMGIVAHSDVSESAKLIINGTLKQHNFINENNIPSDSSAKILYNAMFDDACSQYHFDTDEGKYVNTGIISMSALFNASDITDNANTGYVGSTVSVNSVNGYVYTQPNTSGSVDNSYSEEDYSATTQGTVPPTISFDHTINEVAKTDGSNDYCYEESGTVYISMDEGDSFDWNTSIATVKKLGNELDYTVTMNGTDYTGKTITFDTAGDYTVSYIYTDGYNNSVDENGNVTTYEVTYTKTIAINVSIIKPTTKHAEFTFGSAGTTSTSTTVGNNTYIMPNVTATSDTVGSITVSETTVYYPIVDAYTSDGATAHSSLNSWYMCYPVFKNVISITDYESGGTGNAVTYGSSTTTMPSGLSLTAYSQYFSQTTAPSGAVSFTSGGADTAFKYQASSSASSTPTTLSNVLIYASPTLSNNARDEMYLLVQYKYQDNAGATYYYYVGYHMPQTTVKSVCVTPDTLVTLADGSQKRIDEVTYEDQLLVWDFFTGEYAVVPSTIIFNHGYDNRRVLNLNFEDGITVKVITNHGFYHAESDSFVFIDEDNVESYIGSAFVRMDGEGYDTVKLAGYSITEEYTGAYSIQTAVHNNFMVEGLFSITQPEFDGWFDYFEIGESMKYDEEKMQADIETYGLYTYEDFAEYVTYEQFIAFNGPYLKVLVGKGVVTYEQILDLIATYVNP